MLQTEEDLNKLQRIINNLQNEVKRFKEIERTCEILVHDCLRDKLSLENRHAEEMSDCQKKQTTLRELLIEEKDERTKEKDQLLPFNEKLIEISNNVKNVINIGQEERDLIKQIIGKKFHPFNAKKIVHLDFKGAPPQIQYLLTMIKQLKI